MQEAQTRPRSTGRRWLLLAIAAAVLVAGYFGTMALIRSHVTGVIRASIGKPLPEFSLVDLDGTTWSAAELRGRAVVLNFFRSHCHGCDAEAPAVRALAQELDPDDVVLLGVMTDAVLGFDPADTVETLRRKAFEHPVLMADQALVDAFHTVQWSHVTPVTYLVDSTGEIVEALRGTQTIGNLRAAVDALD